MFLPGVKDIILNRAEKMIGVFMCVYMELWLNIKVLVNLLIYLWKYYSIFIECLLWSKHFVDAVPMDG